MQNWTRSTRYIFYAALAVALLGIVMSAHALRVKRLSLDELRQHAHSVLLGTVAASNARRGDKNMVWTDYVFEVEETLAGTARTGRVTVSFAGGELDGRQVGILHAPKLDIGARYVLFLLPDRPYAVPTVGWGQGIYQVIDAELDGQQKTQRQILLSADGEPLEQANGELVRGAKLQLEQTAEGRQRLRLPRAQTLGRSDYFQKEADPQNVAADGNVVPLTPARSERQSRIAPPAQREFATLDDLRAFVRSEPRP